MKKLLLVFCFGLYTIAAICQTDKQALETVTEDYIESLAQKDWRASFNFIYPGVFELIDKEVMLEMIDELINDDKIDFSVNNVALDNIGDIKTFDGGMYSNINYTVDFKLTMKEGFSHSRAATMEEPSLLKGLKAY